MRTLLTALLWMVPANAQDAEEPGYSFDDDDLVIIGEVQKPEVTVVISRENLNKKFELELKESFLPKITKALEKPPF